MPRAFAFAAVLALASVWTSCAADHRIYCDPTTAGVGEAPPRTDTSFRFDSTVDDETKAAITRGGGRWATITDYEHAPVFQANATWLIQVRTLHAACVGNTDRAAKVIAIAPFMGPGRTEAAAAHEIGHALGLEHLPDDTAGVMNRAAVEVAFTPADITECRRVLACPK